MLAGILSVNTQIISLKIDDRRGKVDVVRNKNIYLLFSILYHQSINKKRNKYD